MPEHETNQKKKQNKTSGTEKIDEKKSQEEQTINHEKTNETLVGAKTIPQLMACAMPLDYATWSNESSNSNGGGRKKSTKILKDSAVSLSL